MLRPGYFFEQTSTGSGTGTSVLKAIPTESVTAITRSQSIYCPALSTVCIDITGTSASVDIVSNPFGPSAKDKILATLTASGQYVVASAGILLINVTAVTDATVSARVVFNQELDC